MWLDIIVAAILALSVSLGVRQGFAYSFFHSLGLIFSVFLAYFTYKPVTAFLSQRFEFYNSFEEWVFLRLESRNLTFFQFAETLPGPLQAHLNRAESTIDNILPPLIFSILCFILLVFTYRFILLLFTFIMSKKHHDGSVGFVDTLLGFAFGAIRGILILLLLLALIVPANAIIKSDFIIAALEDSVLARFIYENNPIFMLP